LDDAGDDEEHAGQQQVVGDAAGDTLEFVCVVCHVRKATMVSATLRMSPSVNSAAPPAIPIGSASAEVPMPPATGVGPAPVSTVATAEFVPTAVISWSTT